MKRQIQKTGKRPWSGAELIKLQDELYDALEALYKPYMQNFVIYGCEYENEAEDSIGPGIVFIDGNICRFEGGVAIGTGDIYLNKQVVETTNKTYGDLIDKPTEKHFNAIVGDANSSYIKNPITAKRTIDVMAPRSDSRANFSSHTYASSKSVADTNADLAATSIQDASSATMTIKFSKTQNKVHVKFQPINISPVVGAIILALPAGYRPSTDLLVLCSSGAIIKITTDGNCTIESGTAPGGVSYYYLFEFSIF